MSETARYRHLLEKWCWVDNPDKNRFKSPNKTGKVPGVGIDLASGGDPIVPWAWQCELPHDRYMFYNSDHPVRGPIQLRADVTQHKASEGESLDFVYCSHLLEDVVEDDWNRVMSMWASMLKVGGHLIILCPERNLWAAAIRRGQSPNCSHKYEPLLGDISRHAKEIGLEVVEEKLTALDPEDYTIAAILKRV